MNCLRMGRGGYDRDFWTGQPLGSGNKGFKTAPAFWSFAYKMMAYLLDLVGRPEGHGIRPNSLKAEAISALMTDVVKGNANSPTQLAIRENYRLATAQAMSKIYSRNVAKPQLVVSNPPQASLIENKDAYSMAIGQPVFSANSHRPIPMFTSRTAVVFPIPIAPPNISYRGKFRSSETR